MTAYVTVQTVSSSSIRGNPEGIVHVTHVRILWKARQQLEDVYEY